jgi:DNA-binding SARP family transcriptional activator
VRVGRLDRVVLASLELADWLPPCTPGSDSNSDRRVGNSCRSALEARVDADLALGRHRDLVPELDALIATHPFREHLLEQQALALYRSGRQAEALDAYRRGAGRLRSELGLDPSRGLREREQRILRQDPALDPPPAAVTGGEVRRRG